MKIMWLSFCLFFCHIQLIHSKEEVEFKLPIFQQDKVYQAKSGHKKLVTFFASWCTACQKEVPLLKKLKENSLGNYEFIAVNTGETDQKIKKFLVRYDAGFLVLKDEDISFSKSLGIFELPWNMIVDENGKILYQGHKPPEELL